MGEYFVLSNPLKRQYIHAGLDIGSDKIRGLPGLLESRAMVLLACRASFPVEPAFAGAWVGDPVLVGGDEATPDPPCDEAPLQADAPMYALRYWEAHNHFASLDVAAFAAVRGIAPGCYDFFGPENRPPPLDAPLARAGFARGGDLLFVNDHKRQFLRPAAFCSSADVMGGTPANVAVALAYLVCRSTPLARLELGQSWSRDPITIVRAVGGSDDEWLVADEARASYEDISYRALAMLAKASTREAADLAERAAADPRDLVLLGNVVSALGAPELAHALSTQLGARWMDRYRRALTTVEV
jgi:hypothetical protein